MPGTSLPPHPHPPISPSAITSATLALFLDNARYLFPLPPLSPTLLSPVQHWLCFWTMPGIFPPPLLLPPSLPLCYRLCSTKFVFCKTLYCIVAASACETAMLPMSLCKFAVQSLCVLPSCMTLLSYCSEVRQACCRVSCLLSVNTCLLILVYSLMCVAHTSTPCLKGCKRTLEITLPLCMTAGCLQLKNPLSSLHKCWMLTV